VGEPIGIGVDIGGTRLRIAIIHDDGTVTDRHRAPTPASEPDLLLEVLTDRVSAYGPEVPDHLPVGVGIAGLVTPDGTVRYGPNIGVRDLPLGPTLERRLGRPVRVLNDASAAALGEQRAGAGQGHDDVLLFTLGTGVGGGVVVAGQLLVGASGFAGELGHLIVQDGGRRCPCGNHGCIEAYASGTAIGHLAADLLTATEQPSTLRQASTLDGPAVSAAAADGDALARDVLAEVGRWLGVAIASSVNALDPSLVLIGGGAAAAVAPYVLPTAREATAARLLGGAYRTAPPIELAVRGDDAGMLGAAWFAAGHHGPAVADLAPSDEEHP